MSLLLDAGALIAYERGSQTVQAFLENAYRDSDDVRTTTAIVAQTWHGDARQVRLARLLRGVDERELTTEQARTVGRLLRNARSADVVAGTLVDIAKDGDEVLTSDPADIRALAVAAGKWLTITPVA
ncbi:MAG: twitching motility protein PilT [Actinomycetota bacterium]|nr:twitching motility protein PilT [Actinomycetota bacterium]